MRPLSSHDNYTINLRKSLIKASGLRKESAFKILKGFEGIEEKLFLKRHISNIRGHSMKLYKDRVNRDILKYSFANRVIEQWNKLPEKNSASSINSFKTKIHKYPREK